MEGYKELCVYVDLIECGVRFLALNPKAQHNEVMTAVRAHFWWLKVRPSLLMRLVDEAYLQVQREPAAGLPLFAEVTG